MYVIIYEQNNSLRVSIGPSVTFNSIQLHEHKETQKLTEQLPCDSLDGGPLGHNLAQRFNIFEFHKKCYTWPCSD